MYTYHGMYSNNTWYRPSPMIKRVIQEISLKRMNYRPIKRDKSKSRKENGNGTS